MAKNKTTETSKSATDFINAVPDETKRKDSFQIVEMMRKISGFDPKMWGPSIIGFGSYHYKYESGREGDAPMLGFSPRKAEIVLYLALGEDDREKLLKQFGKHKTGKGCIYFKKLEDVNVDVLKEMIKVTVENKKV
jgi:hypothetical protein